jgi:hypothetical protein
MTKASCLATVVFAVLGMWAQTGPEEEVEVIVKSARVKVDNEVIAAVKRGDRLSVLRREGSWVAVGGRTIRRLSRSSIWHPDASCSAGRSG